MVARVQRQNAGSLFVHPQLSVSTFSALVLKICRNRFSCHGGSVAEQSSCALFTFGHFLAFFTGVSKRFAPIGQATDG